MKELLRFKYKNTELCLLENEGKLYYVKIVNGNFIFDITEEEREIINKVLAKLTPSRNIYDFGFIKYNQKRYRHFYDMDRNFHLFYEGEDLKLPNQNDMLILNKVFNNQEEYFAYRKSDQDNFYKPKKVIKRVIAIGLSFVAIVYITSEGIKYLNNKFKIEPISPIVIASEVKPTRPPKVNDIPLAYDDPLLPKVSHNHEVIKPEMEDIYKAIEDNIYISQEEKELLKNTCAYYYDSIDYIEEKIVYTLRNLKIEYIKNPSENGVKGIADKVTGVIRIYNAENFNEAPKDVLEEEGGHFLNSQTTPSYGVNFYEFLIKLNKYEKDIYYGNSNNGYNSLYSDNYCYALALFLDKDTLNKALVNSDPNIIIENLKKIIPDGSLALNLLINIDAYENLVTSVVKGEVGHEAEDTLKYLRKSIEATLNAYYNAKYQDTNEDNLNILYFIDKDRAIDIIGKELEIDNETISAIKKNPDMIVLNSRKGIFVPDTSMNLAVPVYHREEPKIYSKDELLIGKDGLKYDSIDEIMHDPNLFQVDYEHYRYVIIEESYDLYNVPDTISKDTKSMR